ncbi:hypothetical protein [Paracoccus thiocyanatus]|uniref:Tetratricopeptide repeat protein n=1 Tax=Paracoccus thiocyanatus TaxID=34006 RepID=A0A3D8PBH0_9RHOB|nr:hypothetical protein [Paracoccus thiocyanatus]RDW12787.1 hypothetical protein DIE28_11720 [Paracoccus thiocyanatus]
MTFGGQPSGLAASGFGTGWCLGKGWDTIYVAQRAGTQYQDLPLDAFVAAVAPVVSGRDVVCYGSSLGAYAALYYGGSIDARIIAAAPMLPAWPPLNRVKDAIPLRHQPLQDAPRSRHAPVLLYDPMVPDDKTMVESMVLPRYPDARAITVEFAGHTILQMLARSGLISQILVPLFLEDRIVEFELDPKDNSIWHFRKGRHLMRDDPQRARQHLERSLDIEPSRHVIGNLLSLLLRLGDDLAAQRLVDRVRASDHPEMRIPPGNLERARAAGLDLGRLG